MKILTLAEIHLSKSDTEILGQDLFSILATLSYAVNEINVFVGLFLSSPGSAPTDRIARKKAGIQKLVLTRTLNAKIFEAFSSLTQCKQLLPRLRDKETARRLAALLPEFEEIKAERGYMIAKELRDKTTNHYLPTVVKQNLRHGSETMDGNLYLHETQGDTFYPFAEDHVFGACVHQLAHARDMTPVEVIDVWMEWSIRASAEVTNALEAFATHAILEKLPDKKARERKIFVEKDLAVGFRDRKLPLFHSLEKTTWLDPDR